MKDWDLRPDGSLKCHPTISWQYALGPMTGLLRLKYAEDERQYENGGVALQLAMTPVQLRQLSADLCEMADRIDAQNLGTKQ